VNLVELHIDRAYLSSSLVQNRTQELTIYYKAWHLRNGKQFTKTAFTLDWDNQTICCPNQVTLPFREIQKNKYPALLKRIPDYARELTTKAGYLFTGKCLSVGGKVQFPKNLCATCPLRHLPVIKCST